MTSTPEEDSPGSGVGGPEDLSTDDTAGSEAYARAVDALVRRLASEHPEVSEPEMRRLVTWCLEVTADASVQRFRLVLAERTVRRYLRPDAERAAWSEVGSGQ